jgi:cell division protein FtsW
MGIMLNISQHRYYPDEKPKEKKKKKQREKEQIAEPKGA